MAAPLSKQLSARLKGSSCAPCSSRVLWLDDAAETWKIAVRPEMWKYFAKPQAAIGQDSGKLTSDTLGETKKMKQAFWRAKKLTAELRPKKVVGCDTDNVAGWGLQRRGRQQLTRRLCALQGGAAVDP